MKVQDIKEMLEKHQIKFEEQGIIWGSIIASIGAYNNGIGKMMHTMKDHILHFSEEGLTLIAVDDINGTLQEQTLRKISLQNIESVHFDVKLTLFIMTILTNDGEIKYKIRKKILGCPWHKTNLSFLLFNSLNQQK